MPPSPPGRPGPARRAARQTARRGFTLTELVVAATLTAVLFAVAIPFFVGQSRAVGQHAGRLDAQLGVRYALASIERDLRSAGVGVVDAQPMLVEGDARAVTFNADLVANRDTAYGGAVNFDPDAPDGAVGVLERDGPVRLPATGRQYPDCTYVQTGAGLRTDSRAETISYWVRRDSTTTREDEYVLFRRVNRLAPELVARGVVLQPGEAVFTYFKTDPAGRSVAVRADSMPMVHAAMHGSAADVGRSALTDSVRVVRVRLAGRTRDRRTGRQSVAVAQTSVRLLNAGLLRRTTCGEAPLPVATFTAQSSTAGGIPSVTLRWPASIDEAGGERDAERYLIFRRREADPPDFDEPLLSLVSGRANYVYVDNQVVAGGRYIYGLAAQDCSPQNSPVVQTGVVQP